MTITPDLVKKLRARTGWSTYKLAKEIGCNQSTVWRIENGHKFSGVIAKSLARIMDAHPERETA